MTAVDDRPEQLTQAEVRDLLRAAAAAKAERGHLHVRYTDRGEQLVTTLHETDFKRTAA